MERNILIWTDALIIGAVVGDGCGNFSGQSGNISPDIVQRVFAEDGAVVHLYNEAAFGVKAGADAAGVPVYPDNGGFNVNAQNADIGKGFTQLGNQCLAILTLGVQELGKSHMYSFLSIFSYHAIVFRENL